MDKANLLSSEAQVYEDDDTVDDGLKTSCSAQERTSLGPASSRPTPIRSR